jgi:alcohol dehydrogenase/L-iditol 2-dehydrogenase
MRPIVQISLDLTSLEEALTTARLALDAGVDWLEAGTPFLLAEGLHGVRALRAEFPGTPIVADLKTMDGGYLEAEMMAKAGATHVVVMARAHEETVKCVVAAGRDYGIEVMGDNLGCPDMVGAARRIEALGCDYVVHHIGYDERRGVAASGRRMPSPLDQLREVVGAVGIPVQAVGGLTIEQAMRCPEFGAPLVVIGAPSPSTPTRSGPRRATSRASSVSSATASTRMATFTSEAVVNYDPAPHSVEIRQHTPESPGEDDVILAVEAVGVCGSDLHQWTSTHSWPVRYPVVLGHEFAGVVAAVGARVKNWREGDRAVSETAAVVDPDSPLTRQGLYNLDPSRRGFGYGVDGAMTRFVRVPARCLHRVPDGLPFERACLTEPSAVAYNAVVNNTRVTPGDRVVVLGPGPIGILCAAVARLAGADVALVGLERDRARLAVGAAYGATPVVGAAAAWARERDALGADVVIDAAGVSAALDTALDLVRPNGWITKVGWGPQPLGFSLDRLVQKNVTLQGSFSHNWPVWERVLALLASGRLDVGPIVGGVWPVAGWREAFEKMHAGEVVKAVLRPSA